MASIGELTGKKLGQYILGDLIGVGGMASVYLARQESIGRMVAVKVMPRYLTQDPNFLQRFEREARLIALLQHPRILPIHDYGTFEGQPYLVMAYLPGGSLLDRIPPEGMALDECTRLVEQIAEGLDYAHQKGVMHRDFKPSNVLLDNQENAYLADFGIAKIVADTASGLTNGSVVGTFAYMAPEMVNQTGVTPAVDIYALGVTVYQMLTGRHPYDDETPARVIIAHLNTPVPDILNVRPDLPPATREVIVRAMAKRPEERYASALDMAADLRAALSEETRLSLPIDLEMALASADNEERRQAVKRLVEIARSRSSQLSPLARQTLRRIAQQEQDDIARALADSFFSEMEAELLAERARRVRQQLDELEQAATRAREQAETKRLQGDTTPLVNSAGKIRSRVRIPRLAWLASGVVMLIATAVLIVLLATGGNDRQEFTLQPGGGIVWSAEFSPVDPVLAVATEDGRITLWDTRSNDLLQTLEGHHDEVYSVAYSPDGRLLVSGSNDQSAIVWNARSGEKLLTIPDHPHAVLVTAFSPDMSSVMALTWDTLYLWDSRTGHPIGQVGDFAGEAYYAAFSPDGETIAVGTDDGSLLIIETDSLTVRATLKGPQVSIYVVGFSPDGQLIAAGSLDDTVAVWDVSSEQNLLTLASDHPDVYSVAFSIDGSTLAVGMGDGSIVVWDVSTGKVLYVLSGHRGWVNSLDYSRDGRWLASGSEDGKVIVWDVGS